MREDTKSKWRRQSKTIHEAYVTDATIKMIHVECPIDAD